MYQFPIGVIVDSFRTDTKTAILKAAALGADGIQMYVTKGDNAPENLSPAARRELLDFVKSNKVEKVLVYECSRLSRRQLDFLSIIEQLTEAGVSLYILQNGLETLLPDGKPNPIANLCFGIIAEFNNLEKNLIRARMSSGYEHHRASGGRVGRKEGYRKSDDEFRTQYDREISLLSKGNTLKDVRAITGTSINTLRKLKENYCLI